MAVTSTCVIESQTGLATVRGNEYSMVAGLGALQVAEIDSRDPVPVPRLIALSSAQKILHFVALCSSWSIRLAVSGQPGSDTGRMWSLVYSRYCIVRMRWHGKTFIKFLVLPFLSCCQSYAKRCFMQFPEGLILCGAKIEFEKSEILQAQISPLRALPLRNYRMWCFMAIPASPRPPGFRSEAGQQHPDLADQSWG